MCSIYGEGLRLSAAKADGLIIRHMRHYVTFSHTLVPIIVFGSVIVLLGVLSIIFAPFIVSIVRLGVLRAFGLLMGLNAMFLAREFSVVYSVAVDTLILCFRK